MMRHMANCLYHTAYYNLHVISTKKPSLVAQTVKHLPVMWETQVQSLDREGSLEKEMATHSMENSVD